MMITKTEFEVNKLNGAVNEFSSMMKERLIYKAATGVRGWDKKTVDDLERLLDSKLEKEPANREEYLKWLLDISALSMFLYTAIKEGRYE